MMKSFKYTKADSTEVEVCNVGFIFYHIVNNRM